MLVARCWFFGALAALAGSRLLAQMPAAPDWKALEDEMMRHYQAVLRLDTSNPPGNEHLAVDYLKQVLATEGIDTRMIEMIVAPRS